MPDTAPSRWLQNGPTTGQNRAQAGGVSVKMYLRNGSLRKGKKPIVWQL